MKVRDAMASPALEVAGGETCLQAAAMMRDFQTGALVVVGDRGGGSGLGIITDRDLVVRCMAVGADPSTQRVADYAVPSPTSVDPDASLESAVELMRKHGVHRLPVVDQDGHVAGMLSIDDIAGALRPYVDNTLAVAERYHLHRIT